MIKKIRREAKMKNKPRPHRFIDVPHTGYFNVAGGTLRAGRIFHFRYFFVFSFIFSPETIRILTILADSRTPDDTDDLPISSKCMKIDR